MILVGRWNADTALTNLLIRVGVEIVHKIMVKRIS